MENIEIITLQRSRNFSRRVNATFEFIKQNFKSLFKAILFIAGPSVLLSVALIGSFMGDLFSIISADNANPDAALSLVTSPVFWLQILLLMAFFLVTTVMSIAAINQYIVLYDEKKTNKISVNEVWERVRSSFWSYAGGLFMMFVILMGVYIGLAIVMAVLAMISEVMMFFGILGLYVAIIFFAVSASMTFFIMTYEKRGFFDSFARSFKLINGKWWSTFGYYIIIYFIMSTIAMVFIMPIYIYMFVVMFHSIDANQEPKLNGEMQWVFMVFVGVYYMVSVFIQMLPNIAVAFQYFNLTELKESKGLISQIESIGETPSNLNTTEEQY